MMSCSIRIRFLQNLARFRRGWQQLYPLYFTKSLFFGDTSGVFDKLPFSSVAEAEAALQRNDFARFADDKNAQGFIAIPQPPFHERPHPNGPIYSSGRFWR